jgi:hypothetical protein
LKRILSRIIRQKRLFINYPYQELRCKIMAEPVSEMTGGNFSIQLTFRKKDRAETVENDLIAEVDSWKKRVLAQS